MIERFLIKNELTLRRWRTFKKRKSAVISVWLFGTMAFFSFSAEFWANSKPVLMSYNEQLYVPVLVDYHPTEFGQTNTFITNYRKIDFENTDNWALWPIIKWDPYESNKDVTSYPSPPSEQNLFGTDDRGRDVLSRLLYGFRYSVAFALFVWVFSSILGIVAGSIMGFSGGKIDLVGQRLVEIWESIPYLLLLLIVIATFSPNLTLLAFFTSVFGWMIFAAYTRAEFLKLRKREFIEAARALGASRSRMVFKHILPNALTPLVTLSPFIISSNIGLLTALDYLGFGLQPPTPSWGDLLAQAQNWFTVAWWLATYTSIFLFLTLFLLILIGDAIRDAFDPRKT